MKVCIICEGCYPYVTGGVSSWVQMLMSSLPEIEFNILSIVVDREHGGKFKYKFPDNMTSITELYLQDNDYVRSSKKLYMSKKERAAFKSFVMGNEIDWPTLFDFFHKNDVSLNSLLLGPDIMEIIKEFYDLNYYELPFTDFLWTYRSMMLPICTIFKNKLPKADIYHSSSTGYAGILACMAKYIHKKPAIITEHGIYTREREEDIIRASFVTGSYKDIWISHFYKLSDFTYSYCDKIISLFENARNLQIELGCDKNKTLVIPNGVNPYRFDRQEIRDESDNSINLGIIARIAPIKDIKTLINSFAAAKLRVPELKLYIMGGYEKDDEEYNDECLGLVKNLELEDVYFLGNVNVEEYMGKMDIVILTSISEGQPISILEAMSARKPCIATKVGNCEELLRGQNEGDKPCGIITQIMSVGSISDAIVELATDKQKRLEYGHTGRERIEEKYIITDVIDKYRNLYNELYNKDKSISEPKRLTFV